MPRISFDTVRKIAAGLPEVEEGTAWGSPALKVRGNLLACVPTNRAAEPDSLVVCIDFEQRAGLLAEDPETYYLPDHYVNYPSVLVRLSRIHPDALRDLLKGAWRFVSAKKARRGRRTASTGTRRRRDAT